MLFRDKDVSSNYSISVRCLLFFLLTAGFKVMEQNDGKFWGLSKSYIWVSKMTWMWTYTHGTPVTGLSRCRKFFPSLSPHKTVLSSNVTQGYLFSKIDPEQAYVYSRWVFHEAGYVWKEPKIAVVSFSHPFENFNIISVDVIVQSYKFLT